MVPGHRASGPGPAGAQRATASRASGSRSRQVVVASARSRSTRPSTTRRSPPAAPSDRTGTPAASARAATSASRAASTQTTTRDGPSENSARWSARPPTEKPTPDVDGHLGQGQADPAAGHVVHAAHDPVADQAADHVGHRGVEAEVQPRQVALPGAARGPGPLRAAEGVLFGPDQQQSVPVGQARPGGHGGEVVDEAQQPDHRRGVDVGALRRVVEADVAADHGDPEGRTGLAHAVDRIGQLAHDHGVLGVTEVQAVDQRQGPGADAGQVEDGLGHDQGRALSGVDGAPPVVAVGGEGQAPAGVLARGGVLQPQHRGVVARADHRVQEELVVVLPVDPGGVGQQAEQVRPAVVGDRADVGVVVGGAGRPVLGPVVQGGGVVERRRGHIGQHLAVPPVEDPQLPAGGDPAHDVGRHLPAGADGQDLVEVAGLDDGQHPLLGLRGHHLEGRHAGLAAAHRGHVHVHAHAGPGGRLTGGTGQAGPAEVLDADHEAGVQQGEAGLDEALLLEGVPDLHRRALVGVGRPR